MVVQGFQEATFWLQVEPQWSRYRKNDLGDPLPESAKAVALTQKRPDSPRPGTVMMRLTVRIPDAAFMPLRPEAVIVVPESMVAATPITVEATSPQEG